MAEQTLNLKRSVNAPAARPYGLSWAGASMTLYLVAVFTFLSLPILVLMLLAFNDSQMTSFPFRGFTLEWFRTLVGDDKIIDGLYNSFIVAIWATLASVVVGTLAAYALLQHRFRGRLVIAAAALLPVVVPKTVLGLAILTLTSHLNVPRTLITVIFGHVLFCLPFVIIIVGSVIVRVERDLVEAARDLGASEFSTFFKVLLPLILNGIVAGAFVAFILSFAEFNLSFFLSGREQTLPLVIFSEFRFEITPKINALAVAMVSASIAMTVAAEYFRTRRGRTGRGSA